MAIETAKKIKRSTAELISILAWTLGAISNGMHFGYSAPLFQPYFQYTECTEIFEDDAALNKSCIQQYTAFLETSYDQKLFRTFYMLGAMAGFLLSLALPKIASKNASVAASIVSLISWIFLASTSSIPALFAARVLAGVSLTLTLLITPTYFSEILDQKLSNSLKELVFYALLLGIFIVYLLVPALPYLVPPIIGAIIVVVQLALSFLVVESPYYLVKNNKTREAIVTLKRLRSKEIVDKELLAIQTQILKRGREKNGEALFNTIDNRKASIKIVVVTLAQHCSGMTVFIMFLHEIIHDAILASPYPFLTGLAFILSLALSAFLNEANLVKQNSKNFIISSVLSALACLSLGVYFSLIKNSSNTTNIFWLPVVAVIIYGWVYKFDKGYLPNLVVEKFYSGALQYKGLQFCTFVHILGAWITIELFQGLKFSVGIEVPFYIFGILNIINSIILLIWIPLWKMEKIDRKNEVADVNEDTELIGDQLLSSNTAKDKTTDAMTVAKTESIFKGTFPQLIAVLAGTLTAVSDGMQYGWTAPVLPILLGPDSPVKVTKAQGEWVENLLMLGSFSGLTITMYLVDRIGRKKSILLASFVTVCIWILTALAPSVEYIYVARAFAGSAGNMAFVATPMYIAEIAEQKIRGFLSSLIYLMMLFGIFIIYAVAPYIPFYAHCLLGALLALTELIIFPFMPDSPYYLLYKDQPEEAEKSLRRLRAPGLNIDKELEDIKAAVARQKEERGKLQDLVLVPSNRKAIIIMAVLNIAQHFSSISVLLMNTHTILDAAGSIYIAPEIAAILFALLMTIAASVACATIDKFGRRTLLISSSSATGLCLMVLAIYFSLKNSGYNTDPVSWIPVVCVMTYALVFKLGMGMVPIVLTAELFPTKMKAYGMTLADGMYVIGSLLSMQVYQRLYDSFGLQYPFYVFSICCYFSAIFTYFFIPETKGKTLEEIQMILKGRTAKDKGKNQDVI